MTTRPPAKQPLKCIHDKYHNVDCDQCPEDRRIYPKLPTAIPLAAPDPVNRPKHYNFGKFDVFDVLVDWFPNDPVLWQVGKYIARAKHKGNELQDLEKAEWYLKKRIENLKGEKA